MTNFSVAIIGGGIGGLALAHGLRRAGIDGRRLRAHPRTHRLAAGLPHPHQPGRAARPARLPAARPAGSPSWTPSRPATAASASSPTGAPSCSASPTPRSTTRPPRPPTGTTASAGSGCARSCSTAWPTSCTWAGVHRVRADRRPGHRAVRRRQHGHRRPPGRRGRRQLPGPRPAAAARPPGRHRRGRGGRQVSADRRRAPACRRVLTDRANLVVPRGRGLAVHRRLATAHGRRERRLRDLGLLRRGRPVPGGRDHAGRRARCGSSSSTGSPGWSPAFRRLVGGSDPATVNALRVRARRRSTRGRPAASRCSATPSTT